MADTSLVIAAFASWHEGHESARRALDGGLRLIEHCAVETYSVLTRLPPPHRTSGAIVRDYIEARFPQPFLRLSAQAYKDFVLGLPDQGVTGGAAYDALVAAIAADFGRTRHVRPARAAGVRAVRGADAAALVTSFVTTTTDWSRSAGTANCARHHAPEDRQR